MSLQSVIVGTGSRKGRRAGSKRTSVPRVELLERREMLYGACSASAEDPEIRDIRGKEVQFDQCFDHDFTHDGVDYRVHVYYTEVNRVVNLNQCTDEDLGAVLPDDAVDVSPLDGIPDRCEHAIPDDDTFTGDNVFAVLLALDVEDVFRFYTDLDLEFIDAGDDEITVYVAEDPGNGGSLGSDGYFADDEYFLDAINRQINALHEMQHMVQAKYGSSPNSSDTYREGIARGIQDRFDMQLDVSSNGGFHSDFNDYLERTDENLFTLKYDNVPWWTWLMDQYRAGNAVDPPLDDNNDLGWGFLRDFYLEHESAGDVPTALTSVIADQGSTFREDFIDFTLAAYAFIYNPSDSRLGFIDSEITSLGESGGIKLDTLNAIASGYAVEFQGTQPYSANYWELSPANQCDYTAFAFDGLSTEHGWSVMTVDNSTLQDRWSVFSGQWARTVRTKSLDRIVGVAAAFDESGLIRVEHGCVTPSISIKYPNSAFQQQVGEADDPRQFLVRLSVTDDNAGAVAGLVKEDFNVTIRQSDDPAALPIIATIINAAYVQDDYWLRVQAPAESAGAITGQVYNLTVALDGTISDTREEALIYLDEPQDVFIILDRSGSMGDDSGKIEAARTAGVLFTGILDDDDQGGYVAFSTNAELRESLDEMDENQRSDMNSDIAMETVGGQTSIGDGLQAALDNYNLNANDDHTCHFVLLSDGMENEEVFWDDVADEIVASGCRVHTVALGPQANETLMQEIAAATNASFDYATTSGEVPVNSVLDWQLNLSRVYDNVATRVAGRQRTLTQLPDSAVGGPTDGVIDFEDLDVGQSFSSGDELDPSGVQVSVQTGNAFIEELGNIGSGNRMHLDQARLDFLYSDRLDFLSFEYQTLQFGGHLDINGQLVGFVELFTLDGLTVADVDISVSNASLEGTVQLEGPIDSFALFAQEMRIDNVRSSGEDGNYHIIPVDATADELVVSVGWLEDASGSHETILLDPAGAPVPVSRLRVSPTGTNDVWQVPDPVAGDYQLRVRDLPQDYFVTASVESNHEFHLMVGTPLNEMTQGVEVPIVTSFTHGVLPLVEADVTAVVTAPDGQRQTLVLYDDGRHGDGVADDGLYGNTYLTTAQGDAPTMDPTDVVDGSEPEQSGSYVVNATAINGEIRREAMGTFAIAQGEDLDHDGMPDDWERRHGLDPNSPDDRGGDLDMDGLVNVCELVIGTNPRNSDTDGGGESDGSEVSGQCQVGDRNPLDPADDRIAPISLFAAKPGSRWDNARTSVFNELHVSHPDDLPVDIYRRQYDSRGNLVEDWTLLVAMLSGGEYRDFAVRTGQRYQYQASPQLLEPRQPVLSGRHLLTPIVSPVEDPYSPVGHVLVNNGESRTTGRIVDLHFEASDHTTDDHDGQVGYLPGTPTGELQMRVSNRRDFRDAPWRPFSATLPGWDLGVDQGLATVHAQFRDDAENVSDVDALTIEVVDPHPPSVAQVAVNWTLIDPPDRPAGPQPTSWTVQQSDLREIQITFSEPVYGGIDDLVLTNLGVDAPNQADLIVNLSASHLEQEGNVWTLNFKPYELNDGVYRLEVRPSLIDSDGLPLDGDADGTGGDSFVVIGDAENRLAKLAGDWNGDSGASIFDFAIFSYWFGSAVPMAPDYVDLNSDGGVSIFDFAIYTNNFAVGLVFAQLLVAEERGMAGQWPANQPDMQKADVQAKDGQAANELVPRASSFSQRAGSAPSAIRSRYLDEAFVPRRDNRFAEIVDLLAGWGELHSLWLFPSHLP